MGLKLISNDTVAPWNSKVVPPVTRGLEAWFTFDTDAARAYFNRAIGKADAQVVGSPVAFPTHMRFKGGANFLQTQIQDSDEVTILVVGKSAVAPASAADSVLFAGAYKGVSVTPGIAGDASGGNLFVSNATAVSATAARTDGAGNAVSTTVAVVGTPVTSWALRGMRAKTGEATKVFDLTANVSNLGSSVLKRALTGNRLRIGGATEGFLGESDISAVAIYSVALTDDEVALVAGTMRRRMSRLGLTV
ncbi:hypothetical protein ACBQ21_03270 [Pseudomonas putida]|uniref:hypothetical protein n=1 Tax=Pseudomonas putida TaxID=303 RepID=UPI0029F7940D|nr:hypothetical protein [Pseudomonas putida]